MGVIKLFLIGFTVLLVGGVGGMFLVRNDLEIPVQILISANPLSMTVGGLSIWSFMVGLAVGVMLCVAYLIIQFLELQTARRKLRSYAKQIESLRKTSFKDAP